MTLGKNRMLQMCLFELRLCTELTSIEKIKCLHNERSRFTVVDTRVMNIIASIVAPSQRIQTEVLHQSKVAAIV